MSRSKYSSYIICTSPRSGSTLLCALLENSGVAGRPNSYFHSPSLDRWLTFYGLTDERFASRKDALWAVFEHARLRGSAGTGVFGLRMQRCSFSYFMEQLDCICPGRSREVERIEAVFGSTLFVHLYRTDKLAQAVSLVMAEQTGLWHRNADGSELERLAPPREPYFDANAISRHLSHLTELNAEWENWFAREELRPLRISYEDLAKAPQGTLARLLEALGLDPHKAHNAPSPTAKLANATNREWMERYVKELSN